MDNTRDEAFSKRAIESLGLVREPTKVLTLEKLVAGIRRVFVFVLAAGLNTYCAPYALVYARSELGAGKETKKTTSNVRFSKQLDGSTIPTSSNHDVYSSDHEMMQKKGGQTLCPKPISW